MTKYQADAQWRARLQASAPTPLKPPKDFWPEDESCDDFIAEVRRWRDGGRAPLVAGSDRTIYAAVCVLIAVVGIALVALVTYWTSIPSDQAVGGSFGSLVFLMRM